MRTIKISHKYIRCLILFVVSLVSPWLLQGQTFGGVNDVLLIVTDASSCNAKDGEVRISMTDILGVDEPVYTYEWSGPDVTQTNRNNINLTNIGQGEYCVFVENEEGCLAYICATVDFDKVDITSTVKHSCLEGQGSIDLVLDGGNPPYSILWDNGSTANFRSNLSMGRYCVTITESTGCFIADCYDLYGIDVVPFDLVNNTQCGNGEGKIEIIDGTGPFRITSEQGVLVTSDRVILFTNFTPGSHIVMVEDNATGCSREVDLLIPEGLANLEITLDNITHIVEPSTHGSIDISVSGGTEPYTYLWSNGDTNQDIPEATFPDFFPPETKSHSFRVTVTDANGCTESASYALYKNPERFICPYGKVTPCIISGRIELAGLSGVSPFTFNWSGPNGFSSGQQTISNLRTEGDYFVTVTDFAGRSCEKEFMLTCDCTDKRPYPTYDIDYCDHKNPGYIKITNIDWEGSFVSIRATPYMPFRI